MAFKMKRSPINKKRAGSGVMAMIFEGSEKVSSKIKGVSKTAKKKKDDNAFNKK